MNGFERVQASLNGASLGSGGTSDLIVPAAREYLERRCISAQDMDCVMLSSFGAGWTVGSVYLRWRI